MLVLVTHRCCALWKAECRCLFSDGAAQEDFKLAMQGIVCDTDKRVIDEAPAAYKDLTQARSRHIALRVYGTLCRWHSG